MSGKRARSEEAMGRVLGAALELFSSQGFRGTTMRQVAEAAGLSLGNVYHHFPNKEALFERLIERFFDRLVDPELPMNVIALQGGFPDDLEAVATAIEQEVRASREYILLIYVDVIEFQGEHIQAFYREMAGRFDEVYGPLLAERQKRGELGEADPVLSVMAIWRWLFHFFTVEVCFGASGHLGMEPDEAVREFLKLVRLGVLPRRSA
ncbi:MAG: TetR/AcrR family transcriptional regulator [Acidobacteriota bacterium]